MDLTTCPTCSHQMQAVFRSPVQQGYWCAGCGTLRDEHQIAVPAVSRQGGEEYHPEYLRGVRDGKLLYQIREATRPAPAGLTDEEARRAAARVRHHVAMCETEGGDEKDCPYHGHEPDANYVDLEDDAETLADFIAGLSAPAADAGRGDRILDAINKARGGPPPIQFRAGA